MVLLVQFFFFGALGLLRQSFGVCLATGTLLSDLIHSVFFGRGAARLDALGLRLSSESLKWFLVVAMILEKKNPGKTQENPYFPSNLG